MNEQLKRTAKSRTIRLLAISLCLVLLLCVLVFGFLTFRMTLRSSQTIHELGDFYMSGMSEQIAMHFGTTIEFQLAQVHELIDAVSPTANLQSIKTALTYHAQSRGFESLAFYTEDGRFEMIYGPPPVLLDPEPFGDSLRDGQEKIALITSEDGEEMLLLGVPAAYPTESGGTYTALAAKLPLSYVADAFSLSMKNSQISYAVVSRSGRYIIRDSNISSTGTNYFDDLRSHAQQGDASGSAPEIDKLLEAMQGAQEYACDITVGQDLRHLYCSKLPYSEWYLLLTTPYKPLTSSVDSLSRSWILSAFIGCIIILAALILEFVIYFRLIRSQLRDLSDARAAAERASKAKSEFLSNMSHDIRTPMNGIVGMTAIANANLDDPQQVQACLRKITHSSRHLLGMINDILDLSKIESGNLVLHIEEVSLRDILQQMVTSMQPQFREKHLHFNVYIHDVPYEIVCSDSVRLRQILMNLLGNAVKYTPENGVIQVVLYEEASPKGAGWVRTHLRVRDNGIGMSPEFREKLFDSFAREDNARVQKTQGAGLGLAITKYIVDAMAGNIEVESAPGKGTEFHITIDMQKAMAQEVDLALPSWQVLVIDDDEMMCESVIAVLNSLGVRAEWSMDIGHALHLAEERHRQGQDYDVVLLDWTLSREDTLNAARDLRRRCGDSFPILLLSADEWMQIEPEARPAGINGAIAKPLFRSTLFYSLRQYAAMEEGKAEEEPASAVDFTGKHILLAEDNDLNWEIASELLSDLGFTLEWAENGRICAEKFAASPPGSYDAILMDLRMPELTGFEATQAIRKMDRSDAATIPIIAMSADTFPDDIQRCLDCGMNAHIAKPIDVSAVARLLERYLL